MIACIAAVCGSACQALVGDYEVAPLIDSATLCAVEKQQFLLKLDLDSEVQLESLDEYYIAANPNLVEHLTGIAQDYLSETDRRGVTYVLGDAGIGKSYVMRNAFDEFGDHKCTIELRPAAPETRPDLVTSDGVVLNELRAFPQSKSFDLESLLEEQCVRAGALQPLVFLDGIDEIHDDSAGALLQAVNELVLEAKRPFLQVVVAGRPEGFRPWLSNPARTERDRAIVTQFHLEAPRYTTRGDLEFRLRGYLEYAGELQDIEANGRLDVHLDSLVEVLNRHEFLTYSLGNLALGNFAIQHAKPGANETELQIKAGIFDDWLGRNAETHNRPGSGSEWDGPYRRLLQDIAARYANVTNEGEFTVAAQDAIEVIDDDGMSVGEVRVRDALLHSGVAYLMSPSSATPRFRFSPFWLHGFLLESYNERLGATYRGCSTAP